MRSFFPLLGIAAVVVAAPAVAQDDVRKAQQELQRTYATVTKIYVDRDLKAYRALFTPDFTVRQMDGSVWDLKKWLTFSAEDMKTILKVRSSKMVFHHSAFRGKALVSDATEVWENDLIDVKGDYGPKGKVYPVIFQQRSLFTHIRTPKGWILQKLEVKSDPEITVNGKPLVPLARKK